MKRLVVPVVGLLGLAVVLAALAVLLALRVPPPAEQPATPTAPGGAIDEFARLLGIDTAAAGTTYRVVERLALQGEVEVSAAELADITATALTGNADGREVLAASEPIRARFHGSRVEVGTVIDLREIHSERLSDGVANVVEQIRRYAPVLAGRPIFLALDTAPAALDGDLDLGSRARFRIGSLPLPTFLARALGLGRGLREALTIDLRLLELQQVEVRGDRLYLRAAPPSGG